MILKEVIDMTIDTPNSCIYCPFLHHNYVYGELYCNYDGLEVALNKDWFYIERPKGCPFDKDRSDDK